MKYYSPQGAVRAAGQVEAAEPAAAQAVVVVQGAVEAEYPVA